MLGLQWIVYRTRFGRAMRAVSFDHRTAALMGIPIALIITPLLYGVALIIADAVNLFSPLSPEFWRQASEVSRFGRVAFDWLLQQKAADPQALAIGAAVMLLPGILFSLALWAGVNLVFRRSGTGEFGGRSAPQDAGEISRRTERRRPPAGK